MYKTTLTVCANKIIQDVSTNAISIIDVFEEFNAPGLPFVIPNFSILWTLERENADEAIQNGSIRITQNDQELGNFPLNIDFQGSLRTRNILLIGGLVVGNLSALEVEFKLGQDTIASLSFPIKVTPNVAPQPLGMH